VLAHNHFVPLTEGVVGAEATNVQETDVDFPKELGDEEVPVLRLKVRDNGHPEAFNDRCCRGPVVWYHPVRTDAIAHVAQKQLRLSLVSGDDGGETHWECDRVKKPEASRHPHHHRVLAFIARILHVMLQV
jgi:hypothetical protein